MNFVQGTFPVFLAVVLALYWAVPGAPEPRRRRQNALLVVASYVFYAWGGPWMVGLLAFSTLLDFGVALGMGRWPRRRGPLLALSLVGNLGLLGLFKYHDFFVANLAGALGALGLRVHPWTLGLVLPVGISFYTFQTLSYTLDVYRGRLRPRTSLLDHAAFVSLFPQLVAGPVERARDLLPQLEAPRAWSGDRARRGVGLALWGAFKKVVVADTLAPFVDVVFDLERPAPVLAWAGAAAFMVQILADFSGYTDIARGVARLLGFELTDNFRHPYRAASPSEFWRRWHVSFSSWIHEYLYVPLGGRRRGRCRRVLATWTSLLLSGLWHGAAWNFVLWGAFHAALLTAWRAGAQVLPARWGAGWWARPVGLALMLPATLVGWLVFRQPDLGALAATLTAAPWGGGFDDVVAAGVVGGLAGLGGLALLLGGLAEDALARRRLPLPLETTAWALAVALVALFARDVSRDFIYFRF